VRYKIETEGFKELDKALGELPDKIASRTLQRAVSKSMKTVQADFISAAPRSEIQSQYSKQYGRLSENIKTGRAKNKDKSAKSAFISTGNAFWGNFVEFGTKYMPAQPWFVPKFEQLSNRVLDILSKTLKEEIEKSFKRLRK